ncbi:MAG TPA: acyl-CoA dehydrogenase family protein [Kofleriaceae bacterium]|nr:acyl-CoA dehydrogenase family protein [Kofleriaceae bacterium]
MATIRPTVKDETPQGGFLLGDRQEVPGVVAGEPLGQAARDFLRRRVLPANRALEGGDLGRLRALVAEAGQAGLLGAEIPEAFGGLGAPPAVAGAILSGLGLNASFAVTCAAHLTIGTVPLLRHASDALKAEYLPAISAGTQIGAYALTEPAAGSDALNLATRAVAQGGGFLLSGAKQFITNAGIADHLVVIALVDGAGPTAFLVDARAPGLALGQEERKLGLHGSSTRALHLDGVPVSAERVIGAVGQGHRVALDALTVGRHHLGVLAAGHLELLLEVAAGYAAERRQLGRPIGERALVADLLGESVAVSYALEAVVARAAPLCAPDVADLVPAGVEAALCKVLGSEALCAVADATLQIHGGLGYLRGTWAEQSYRDVRVNRIYEGTDEINRRAIAQGLVRAARRGRLPIEAAAREAEAALASPSTAPGAGALAAHVRRMALVGLAACQSAGDALEPLEGPLAELALATYAADSAARRAAGGGALDAAAAGLTCARAVERAHAAYGEIVAVTGRPLPTRGLSLLDIAWPASRGEWRRQLALAALEAGRGPFARYAPIRPPSPETP